MRKALRMRNDNKDFYWELARTYLYTDQSGLALATLCAMTKTLHGGWEHGIIASEGVGAGRGGDTHGDVDRWIHESKAASAFRNYVPPPPPAVPEEGRVRGAVLFLCCADDDELRDLHNSLRRLHIFFTSRFRYPVMVLHDRLNHTEQARSSFLSCSPSPSLLDGLTQAHTQSGGGL
jgi:hypothetical protein